MKYLLFFYLAGNFNAVMDTITHHFYTSVFRYFDPTFWNPNESWKKKNFLGWMDFDAWHIAKFLMLFSFCFGFIFLIQNHTQLITGKWYFDFGLMCLAWAVGFEINYTKVLRIVTNQTDVQKLSWVVLNLLIITFLTLLK
jgi:uncharacterized membrane protein AbrB (regulator of aidB expression)